MAKAGPRRFRSARPPWLGLPRRCLTFNCLRTMTLPPASTVARCRPTAVCWICARSSGDCWIQRRQRRDHPACRSAVQADARRRRRGDEPGHVDPLGAERGEEGHRLKRPCGALPITIPRSTLADVSRCDGSGTFSERTARIVHGSACTSTVFVPCLRRLCRGRFRPVAAIY